MNSNPLRAVLFVFFIFLAFLPGVTKSFAQEDNSSDDQASEENTEKTLSQINDLAQKMVDNGKRLDALEKSVDQIDKDSAAVETGDAKIAAQEDSEQAAQEQAASVKESFEEKVPVQTAPVQVTPAEEAPAEEAPVEQVPVQAVAPVVEQAPVQTAAPVQLATAGATSEDQSTAEIKTRPIDSMPQAPVYYAPLTDFPKEYTFEINQEDFYSTFRESGNNAFNSGGFNGILYDHKSTGEFLGLYSAFSYRPLETENWLINVYHLDVHGDFGYEDYNYGDGAKLKNIDNYIIEPRAWMGKDFNVFSNDKLTPYVGVGYRWYYEQLKNKILLIDETDDILIESNNLQNQYLYIPLGAQLSIHPAGGWRIDMNGEYDFLVWGRVTETPLVFTDGFASIKSNPINNNLNGGYGLLGSVKIIKEGETFNYFIEPYVQFWDIRASKSSYLSIDGLTDTSDPIEQDKNTTVEVGLRAGVDF